MKVVKYFLFTFISIGSSALYAQKAADTATMFSAPKKLGVHTAGSDTITAFAAPKQLGVHDKVTDTANPFVAPKAAATAPAPAAPNAFSRPRPLGNHASAAAAAKPAPANAVLQWEAISGNAAGDIFIVGNPKGSCNNGLSPINIINTSADKAIIATVEITTKYGGHVNRKISTVDNLSPNETRSVGCMGCMESSSFKSCFTYRIITATYK